MVVLPHGFSEANILNFLNAFVGMAAFVLQEA